MNTVGVDANLGVQTVAVAVGVAVGGLVGFHARVDRIHDADAELGGLLVHAEAMLLVGDAQEVVAALGKAYHAEHAGKVFLLDKAFGDKEVGFEKAGLLHDELHALVHVLKL